MIYSKNNHECQTCLQELILLLAMQALLLSYNIGVDREQERRKLMSDTAARVGLRMPKYAEEADSS